MMKLLELAKESDREAVNSLALQVHQLHCNWRPDVFEMVEELYPEDRFAYGILRKQLYVAKADELVIGYASVNIRN